MQMLGRITAETGVGHLCSMGRMCKHVTHENGFATKGLMIWTDGTFKRALLFMKHANMSVQLKSKKKNKKKRRVRKQICLCYIYV